MNYKKLFLVSLAVCLLGITIVFLQIPSNGMYSMLSKFFIVNKVIMYNEKNHASSVWCFTRIDHSQICYFKNLFYFPELKGHLVFTLNKYSVVSGINFHTLKEVNLASVRNHTGVNLKLVIVKSIKNCSFGQQSFTVLDRNMLIMKRFKPDNIMHVIHDDLLPIYFTYQEICKGDINLCLSSYHLTFIDNFEEGPYFEWYEMFSNYNPILLNKIETSLCIKNSVIGLSQESVWFQYGFKQVHGPFVNTQFSGLKLKLFSDFVLRQFRIENKSQHLSSEKSPIIFLNRKVNRRVLNDKFLNENVKQIYMQLNNVPAEVIDLDLSTNDSRTVIASLQNSKYLIGMHGSAMLLAIFLPQNSNIIELFPFGIQPDFVSPLKALCAQPNVAYNYVAWVNENENNTVTHPEFSPLHGGIEHLPLSKQVSINDTKLVPPVECCHNPLYLFRMFQDTIVDESFFQLFRRVLNKAVLKIKDLDEASLDFAYNQFYFPPPVFNLTCECSSNLLTLFWNFPFTSADVKFSIATSTGKTGETKSTQFFIEEDKCNDNLDKNIHLPLLSVWVKTFEDHRESLDSYAQCLVSKS